MNDFKWSPAEKNLSRRAFEKALESALSEVLAEFKAKAAAAGTPEEMWNVQRFLASKEREIEEKYDYRYSRLILVFARLLREGRIQEDQLAGLSEEKLTFIRSIASL